LLRPARQPPAPHRPCPPPSLFARQRHCPHATDHRASAPLFPPPPHGRACRAPLSLFPFAPRHRAALKKKHWRPFPPTPFPPRHLDSPTTASLLPSSPSTPLEQLECWEPSPHNRIWSETLPPPLPLVSHTLAPISSTADQFILTTPSHRRPASEPPEPAGAPPPPSNPAAPPSPLPSLVLHHLSEFLPPRSCPTHPPPPTEGHSGHRAAPRCLSRRRWPRRRGRRARSRASLGPASSMGRATLAGRRARRAEAMGWIRPMRRLILFKFHFI
jgi:hypothetical protein